MPKGQGARSSRMLGKAIETDVASIEEQNSVITESGNAVNNAEAEVQVSLTIKVPKSYRQHWQVEAKKRGTSVTSTIVTALEKEYGLPDK